MEKDVIMPQLLLSKVVVLTMVLRVQISLLSQLLLLKRVEVLEMVPQLNMVLMLLQVSLTLCLMIFQKVEVFHIKWVNTLKAMELQPLLLENMACLLGQDGFVTTSFQIRQADDTSRSEQRPDVLL